MTFAESPCGKLEPFRVFSGHSSSDHGNWCGTLRSGTLREVEKVLTFFTENFHLFGFDISLLLGGCMLG